MKVRWNAETKTLTVPNVEGVDYFVDGEKLEVGDHVMDRDFTVTAAPQRGYRFEPADVKSERAITLEDVSDS